MNTGIKNDITLIISPYISDKTNLAIVINKLDKYFNNLMRNDYSGMFYGVDFKGELE